MKKNILLGLVLPVMCASIHLHAQTATAFAITGENKGNSNWSFIREINLGTGTLVRNIYLPNLQKPIHIDASTNKVINWDSISTVNPCGCPSTSLAAASAYDARQKRLYFTTLFGNDLQYIDITKKVLKIYHITTQKLKAFPSEAGEGDNVTRMAFGSDGNGYAITNNGNHFIRFIPGKIVSISDLGALNDKAGNAVSVHAKSLSWGGDLVADDAGSLYLFTVAANVFKINIATQEAEFLGGIKNLPNNYSINAAAVNENGDVTLASSTENANYYSVNLQSLEATSIESPDQFFNASDFANSNVINTSKNANMVSAVQLSSEGAVSVYPNPVKNKTVNLFFSGDMKGKHTVEVVDVSGKKITSRLINLMAQNQTQTVQLPSSIVNGLYIIHVVNANNKKVYSTNLVVE